MRVEVQDDQLAQVKEDNIVLRSQVTPIRGMHLFGYKFDTYVCSVNRSLILADQL